MFYLQHRIEETIRCMTFSELLARHNINTIDLLQMDVEGYELEILSTIDFSLIPIRFINYENVLLQKRKSEAERLMRANGYTLEDHGLDTLCYHAADYRLFRRRR